ncbi:MAG: hypothetical protein PHU56_03075 [Candidatus Pacebacteria bacterium]|nr:hypothetical protein [Candidatus Paceibacterota bacterium]
MPNNELSPKQMDFFEEKLCKLPDSQKDSPAPKPPRRPSGTAGWKEAESFEKSSVLWKKFEDTTQQIGSPCRLSTPLLKAIFLELEKNDNLKDGILKINNNSIKKLLKDCDLESYDSYKNGKVLKFALWISKIAPSAGLVEIKICPAGIEGEGADIGNFLSRLKKTFNLPGVVEKNGIKLTVFLEQDNAPFLKPFDEVNQTLNDSLNDGKPRGYQCKEYITLKEARDSGLVDDERPVE